MKKLDLRMLAQWLDPVFVAMLGNSTTAEP